MINSAELPNDVDVLKAIILVREDRIAELEVLLQTFRKTLFGRKSEKLDPDQYELALEDLESAIEAIKATGDIDLPTPKTTAKPPRSANRGHLPKHLPRIEKIISPDSTVCACGADLHVIGEDVSERLDIIPAQFQVIVTRRPKYACRAC